MDLYLPKDLDYVGGFDWGFSSPSVFLWAACLADHRMHILREWKVTEHTDDELAAGYHRRTKDLGVKVRYVAGDPNIWIRDGRNVTRGQSRAETLIRAGVPMRRAENARPDGWARVHAFLRIPRDDAGHRIGDPLLTIDETCQYLRKSLPAQQSDPKDPDDVNTKGDDHGVDALRYLLMSRPMPTVTYRAEPRVHPLIAETMAGAASAVVGASNVRGHR